MAIYYVWSAAAGSGTGASWANAFTTLTLAFATEVAGDTLYVAHDHAESSASALTLTSSGTVSNPTKIICVDRAGTVPPVSADRRATATVSTTGNSLINMTGYAHYDGIIFTAGNSTGAANFNIPSGNTASLRFDNCSLRMGSTGTGLMQIGATGVAAGGYVELNNTTISFANIGQLISLAGVLKWRNTASALIGSAVPTGLFVPITTRGGELECIGVDLSAAGSGKTLVNNAVSPTSIGAKFRFVDCKLNASVTKSSAPLTHGGSEVDFIRSGATGVNYTVYRHRVAGLLIEETTIIRSGGASDGVTPLSWRIDTTANCNYSMPFECSVIAIWNDVDGSAVTATVEGIWGGGAVPLDDEVWLDVSYLSDNSSPISSSVNDGKANLIATAANQTSSSETWGGSTTAFKLSCTCTPQQPGWLYARVKCAKASTTFYIDPLVTLS